MKLIAEPTCFSERKATFRPVDLARLGGSAGVEERGHADKGSPGTWEISLSPRWENGAGAVSEIVRVGDAVAVADVKKSRRGVVRPSEGNEVRPDGQREVGATQ